MPRGKFSHRQPTNQPKKPTLSKSQRKFRANQAKNSQHLTNAINTALAQFQTNYKPVADPGANKHIDDDCLKKADHVELSYSNSSPCPDPTCKSKDCKACMADITPTRPSSPSPSNDPSGGSDPAPSSPQKEGSPGHGGGASPSSSPAPIPTPKAGATWFSHPLPNQFGFWRTYLLLLALLAIGPLFSIYTHTGFRVLPEINEVRSCPRANSTLPDRWYTPVIFYSHVSAIVSSYSCRISSGFAADLLSVKHDLTTVLRWVVGWDLYDETPAFLSYSIRHPVNYIAVVLIAIVLMASLGRRSLLKVKFRKYPGLIVFFICAYVLCHDASSVRPVREEYNWCPGCSTPITRISVSYSYSSLIVKYSAAAIFLMLFSLGPDYRVYYVCTRTMTSDSFDDKFDHNKRGEKDREQQPDMAAVETHLTHSFHIFRKAWYVGMPIRVRLPRLRAEWFSIMPRPFRPDLPKITPADIVVQMHHKWSSNVRDKTTVSLELLRQACNPSSFSPTIDLKLAIERIARSASNNQNVNISRHHLTDKREDIYGNTTRLAVEMRKSLFAKADRLVDFTPLHPP